MKNSDRKSLLIENETAFTVQHIPINLQKSDTLVNAVHLFMIGPDEQIMNVSAHNAKNLILRKE